jgi:hypothetical protein
MKLTLIALFFSLLSVTGFAQSFEGQITYSNNIKSKVLSLTDQQFTAMLGDTQQYYIKGGDYKATTNGTFAQWQLYINKDNKLYNKMSNSAAVLWNDAAVNQDTVYSSEINKNVIEILGYKCDEIILHCKSGIQKFYFSSKFPVDTKLYSNHQYDNWYYYLTKTNSLPLKIVIDNAQFTLESVATALEPMKLDTSTFALPAGVTLAKSPY